MARRNEDSFRRLRALWTLHDIGALSDELANQALGDPEEYVRGWAIQLLADDQNASARTLGELIRLANMDLSPVVRVYLAAAIQPLPEETA
jgi:hypothetical protein